MEPVRHCPACGQKIRKLNPHRMDKQKLRVLEDIARHTKSGDWVEITEDSTITTADGSRHTVKQVRVHAQRLKYFGLLDYKGRRTARYRINGTGIGFLSGRISVPAIIYCREGKVEERTLDRIFVGSVPGIVLDKVYWDRYYREQKYEDHDLEQDEFGFQ